MRCYYEVLGVNQDVTVEDLRKSYHRLALQLHPDKNPGYAEEAKVKFQELRNAYEVLSDPQERAFYDRNRENIIRGEDFDSGLKENNLHIYKYFRPSCYSGYNDSEKGFYTVYRWVFESIATQDFSYVDDDDELAPNFGRSDTDLKEVAIFYAYWQSYCTSMSFYWVDKYDIRQAQNRWVEKRIEKENKKLRDKAKKEFNEEVRSLVSFVKKRDKRWAARVKQMEEKMAEDVRRQAEIKERKREERHQRKKKIVEEQRESLLQYEEQLKEMESQFKGEWGDDKSSSDDEDDGSDAEALPDRLYCITCEKFFKSIKAFQNHEQSRKHQENRAALIARMHQEEESFLTKNNHDTLENPIDDHTDSGGSKNGDILTPSTKRSKKKKKNKQNIEESSPVDEMEKKKVSKKYRQCLEQDLANLNLESLEERSEEIKLEVEERSEEIKLEVEERSEEIKLEVEEKSREIKPEVEADLVNGTTDSFDVDPSVPQLSEPKKTKLKGKKAKDARKVARENKVTKNDLVCIVCGNQFDSKNKLFSHLRSTGHAAIKSEKSRSKR